MNKSEIILRCWWALRHAIENFTAAQEKNENPKLMKCWELAINAAAANLDRAEGKLPR